MNDKKNERVPAQRSGRLGYPDSPCTVGSSKQFRLCSGDPAVQYKPRLKMVFLLTMDCREPR